LALRVVDTRSLFATFVPAWPAISFCSVIPLFFSSYALLSSESSNSRSLRFVDRNRILR
jgi:hypothetical protein